MPEDVGSSSDQSASSIDIDPSTRCSTAYDDMKQVFHLSMCGCGFLGMYHLGAASCLVRHGQGFLRGVDKVVGASAGSLVASAIVTHQDRLKVGIKDGTNAVITN